MLPAPRIPAFMTEKKRGPGRPSTKPNPPSLEKVGIVQEPNDPSNTIEFVHKNPEMFKDLFTYFKNIKATNIYVRFTPAAITFFTRDSQKLSRIIAHIDGNKVNHYFCAKEYVTGIIRDLYEKMFAQIDKSLYKISILLKTDDPDHLNFIFRDATVDKECYYKMKLARLEPDADLFDAEKVISARSIETNYPVSFTLSDKQFKKTINDMSNYTDKFAIEKMGKEDLQFTYVRASVTYHEVYRSPEKIKLKSTIADHEIFRCDIRIDTIKSLASSMVESQVRLMCRDKEFLIFRSEGSSEEGDEALTLSTIVPVCN